MFHESPARLQEIDRLFAEALDLPPDARRAWLHELASHDPDAATHVAELLEAAGAAAAVSEAMAFEQEIVASVSHVVARAVEGDGGPSDRVELERFGPYRVVREIARGGMAMVYLAERADGAFDQQVALKVLPLAFADADGRRRLQRERQILANLQHPGIARLLDGGADAWGRPFLVMELVEGTPIDRYCDAHRLDLDARLRLIAEAARAVEFAHRNLIIHRDLKPSNVLVTPDGEVKLLDFGIAMLLDPEPQGLQTRTQGRLLTPAYASPEQWRGEPLTTASDIYQLGLMLFELLTGQRLSEQPDADGTRPSTLPSALVATFVASAAANQLQARRTTVAAWSRRLRDDLDTITGTLLHPEPAGRYPSVAAFLEDVARHQQGEPILARRPTMGYRVSRFVRRHRVWVAAAAVVLLAVVCGSATALWQASAARRARDRVQVEAARAQRVADFLIDVFAISNAERALGRDTSARDLLDRAARRVDQELAGEPALQAGMMDVVGQAYHSLGFYDPAESLFTRALAARQQQIPRDREAIATLHQHLGALLHDRGELDDAQQQLVEALAMRRQIYGSAHPLIADTLHAMGWLAHCRGRLDDSERLLQEALAMRRSLLGGADPAVATTLNELGRLALRRRLFGEAERYVRDALDLRRRQLGPRHPAVAASLDLLGMIEHGGGRYAEAERDYRESLDVRRQTLGPSHPDTVIGTNNVASLLFDHEDYAGAHRLYREALDRGRERLGDRHPMVAQYLFNLSLSAFQLSRDAEAERDLRESLAIRESVYGERHMQTAATLAQLAVVLRERGARDEARRDFERALRICRTLRDDDALTATVLLNYGAFLIDVGRTTQAAALIDEGLTLRRAQYGDPSWRTAAARTIAADLRIAQGRRDEAMQLWARAVPILQKERPAFRATRRALARWSAVAAGHELATATGAADAWP